VTVSTASGRNSTKEEEEEEELRKVGCRHFVGSAVLLP